MSRLDEDRKPIKWWTRIPTWAYLIVIWIALATLSALAYWLVTR
jgi:hypothetical protein